MASTQDQSNTGLALPGEARAVSVSPRRLKRLVVMVPAYNEGEKIEAVVSGLLEQSEALVQLGLQMFVYVVNDGSSDDTAAKAMRAGAHSIVTHKVNRGLGAAVRSGLGAGRDAGADILVKFDADLQHDPADIIAMVTPILRDEADVVYGHRFARITYKMPFVRRVGNWVFTRLMAWLTGWPLKDSQPGIFAVDRSYLECFYMPGDYNYTQQILLDAYHKGLRFQHADVTFRSRVSGKSFVSFRYPFKVLPQILMVLVGVKPLKVFAPFGLALLMIAAGTFAWDMGQWLQGDASKIAMHVNLILGTGLFGVQVLFLGVLADLIVKQHRDAVNLQMSVLSELRRRGSSTPASEARSS